MIAVDGGFNMDEPWGLCSKSCNTGTSVRFLPCNDPAPAHGGKPCIGNTTRVMACSEVECPGKQIQNQSLMTLIQDYQSLFSPWLLERLVRLGTSRMSGQVRDWKTEAESNLHSTGTRWISMFWTGSGRADLWRS